MMNKISLDALENVTGGRLNIVKVREDLLLASQPLASLAEDILAALPLAALADGIGGLPLPRRKRPSSLDGTYPRPRKR